MAISESIGERTVTAKSDVRLATVLKPRVLSNMKRIGLLIDSDTSLFANGLIQNAYFLYECILNCGFTCTFLSLKPNPKPFEYKNIPVSHLEINSLEFDPTIYHAIITISAGFLEHEYNFLKSHNVRVFGFTCGNVYMNDAERFVYGDKTPGSFLGKAHVDKFIVISSYSNIKKYFEVTRGKPYYVAPHIWSPAICDSYFKTPFLYDRERCRTKIHMLVLEPNIFIIKNSWPVIVAGEALEQEAPKLLDKISVFCASTRKVKETMIAALQVKPKVTLFDRTSVVTILERANAEDSMPIIVSYQNNNSLNYLYYECLHYGFPLVHNSPDLQGCGYYYPENDIELCRDAILYAYTHHTEEFDIYRRKGNEFLKKLDPSNPHVVDAHRGILMS